MRLKLTFEDGSSGYLKHYGVLGMKWGVRNAETLARYNRKGIRGAGANVNFSGGGGAIQDEKYEGSDKDFPEKDRIMSPDEDMALVNPLYQDAVNLDETSLSAMYTMHRYDVEGSMVNCATCSVIYDLRRRGYDVDANATSNLAFNFGTSIQDLYKGAKIQSAETKDEFLATLNEMPDGARGFMAGRTVNGGNHAIAWERENGKTVFRDCQSNKSYNESTIDEVFRSNSKSDDLPEFKDTYIRYERLDDKPANLKAFNEKALQSKTGTSKRERQLDALHANKAAEKAEVGTYSSKEFKDALNGYLSDEELEDLKRDTKKRYAKDRGEAMISIQKRTS